MAADVGEAEAPVDAGNLAQLDAEGHILDGGLRPVIRLALATVAHALAAATGPAVSHDQ